MAKFKNVAVMLTAAEAARQWAMNNPEKASSYIDQATGFIDKQTQGKYRSKIDGVSRAAKKNLTGRDTVSGATTRDSDATGSTQRPFPDTRA